MGTLELPIAPGLWVSNGGASLLARPCLHPQPLGLMDHLCSLSSCDNLRNALPLVARSPYNCEYYSILGITSVSDDVQALVLGYLVGIIEETHISELEVLAFNNVLLPLEWEMI